MARTGFTLINRDFTRLWAGQAVSSVGDAVFDTTLVLWIGTRLGRGRTWAPAAVSGLMLALSLAAVIVGPVAGVFVDRWNRRRTMLRTEMVRALLVGVLAALSFLPAGTMPVGLWLTIVYLMVFVVACMGLFFGPARFATIGDLVTGDADRARAAGIGQATTSTATIVGPPLAAPLFYTIGFQWALVFNALSYLWSWAAIRSIAKPDTSGGTVGADSSIRKEFLDGVRYVGTNQYLRALIVVAVIVSLGTGPLNSLGVFFTTENLHAKESLYGVLSMAIGVGSILGALIAGRVVGRIGARATTWVALLVTGSVFGLYARQTEFPVALVLFAICGFFVTMVNTSISPMLLATTPAEYLGRATAFLAPAVELAQMVTTVAAGWLASTVLVGYSASVGGVHVGRIDTIVTGCAVLILAGGVYGYFALPKAAGSAEPAAAVPAGAGSAEPGLEPAAG